MTPSNVIITYEMTYEMTHSSTYTVSRFIWIDWHVDLDREE